MRVRVCVEKSLGCHIFFGKLVGAAHCRSARRRPRAEEEGGTQATKNRSSGALSTVQGFMCEGGIFLGGYAQDPGLFCKKKDQDVISEGMVVKFYLQFY